MAAVGSTGTHHRQAARRPARAVVPLIAKDATRPDPAPGVSVYPCEPPPNIKPGPRLRVPVRHNNPSPRLVLLRCHPFPSSAGRVCSGSTPAEAARELKDAGAW